MDTQENGQDLYETAAGRFDETVVRRDAPTAEYMKSAIERFKSKVNTQDDGCWVWEGSFREGDPESRNARGYGRFWFNGKDVQAHRFAYKVFVGEIPEDMVLDHLCHNPDTCTNAYTCPHRKCVNPEHLEVTTRGKNVVKSTNTITGKNARKTHCKRGHEFTDENTRVDKTGRRNCRACARILAAQSYRRKVAREEGREVAEYKQRDKAREYEQPDVTSEDI